MVHFRINLQALKCYLASAISTTSHRLRRSLMRQSYFLALLLLSVVGCVKGLVNNDNAAQVASLEETRSTANGGSTPRNLKGSSMTKADDGTTDAEDEERVDFSKMASFFKVKIPGLAKSLGKNTGLTKQVQTLQKDKNLVNAMKTDPKLVKLGSVVAKNPGALTEKKVGMIGSFITKLKAIDVVGDIKGMVIVYGLLFLAVIGIGTTGVLIARNTSNSYIH